MKIHLTLLIALLCSASFAQKPYKPLEFAKNSVEAVPDVWFSKTEVSNGEYDAFLEWLVAQGRPDDAKAFAPDDSVWVRDLAFNDPYAKYYSHHDAFKPYPVVGVSYEAAMAFCEYMTAMHSEIRLKNWDGSTITTKVRFRLPTPAEWIAAAGDDPTDTLEVKCYPGRIWYPRDHKGRFRFNHKLGKGDYAGYAGDKGFDYEGYMITAPVNSFPPDEFLGLHNLAGNVAEMTSERGLAKGGSWAHLQDECRIYAVNAYERPMAWLGFRVVAERIPEVNVNL